MGGVATGIISGDGEKSDLCLDAHFFCQTYTVPQPYGLKIRFKFQSLLEYMLQINENHKTNPVCGLFLLITADIEVLLHFESIGRPMSEGCWTWSILVLCLMPQTRLRPGGIRTN